MPLLGNPTAAVFYPFKLVFALLEYPAAMRVYVIGHVLLAFAGMFVMLRRIHRSQTASFLGAIGYGFGGPVLLLYNNAIYLVGAAWIPWCFWSLTGWLATGKSTFLAWQAIFLGLQLLGGEPQSAYLTWILSVGIAGWNAWVRSHDEDATLNATGWSWVRKVALLIVGLILICWLGAWLAPWFRIVVPLGPRSISIAGLVRLGLILGGVLLAFSAWRSGSAWPAHLVPILAVGLLAGLLAAVGILPVFENVLGSTRGGERFDRYAFSLVPYRLAELLVPGVLGQPYDRNHSWRYALPPENDPTFWVASLYQGGITLVLAILAVCRSRSSGVRWVAVLSALAVLASFGLYAAPAGVGRWLPLLKGVLPVPLITSRSLSEIDFLTGDGSPYYFLTLLVPGLELFRYPSKLFTWFSLGLSVLAAVGWDRLDQRGGRTLNRLLVVLAGSSLTLLIVVLVFGNGLIAWGERVGRPSQQSGPFDCLLAWLALRNGLIQATLVFLAMLVIVRIRKVRPEFAAGLAVFLSSVDLALANRGLVWTVPQSVFDASSEAVAEISKGRDPNGPPPRVHRPPVWYPFGWYLAGSGDRVEQLARWEKQTLQPLHGLPANVGYVLTLGIMESPRYLSLFRPWMLAAGPVLGPAVGVAPASQVLHYPRRAFDLWGADFFLLPVDAAGWRDESRSYASFLENTRPILPGPEIAGNPVENQSWRKENDWQLAENLAAFPRAWIVHQVQVVPFLDRLDEMQKQSRIRTLLFQNDGLWSDPERPVLNLRELAWVESADPARDRPRLEPPVASAVESVSFQSYAPDRAELRVDMQARGLVVVSETDAPGWMALVDGEPARIWRTNLGMRGVVVPAGQHQLSFSYRPTTLRWGGIMTAFGLLVTAILFMRWPGGRAGMGGNGSFNPV